MHAKQTSELLDCASKLSSAHGSNLSQSIESHSDLLVQWLQHLTTYELTGTADHLLEATGSAIRETAACLSLGLVRPTLFSLRGEIDLLLSWLYFKNHQVEWDLVNDSGEGFKLKKEIFLYLEAHHTKFKSRLSLLTTIATRKVVDPYRLLSAHIHSQSTLVLPKVINLKDMVRPFNECTDCSTVAFEVSEYLNDVLLSIYCHQFKALPPTIQQALMKRFTSNDQQKQFFS